MVVLDTLAESELEGFAESRVNEVLMGLMVHLVDRDHQGMMAFIALAHPEQPFWLLIMTIITNKFIISVQIQG